MDNPFSDVPVNYYAGVDAANSRMPPQTGYDGGYVHYMAVKVLPRFLLVGKACGVVTYWPDLIAVYFGFR